MITGDLVKHYADNSSFGVVMCVEATEDAGVGRRPEMYTKVLWLDHDYPTVEWYPVAELTVTSSADLDWENDVVML